MGKWTDYVNKTKAHPPRPLLVRALSYVTKKNAALDLGAGALTDTRYLLEQGFEHVNALDQENVAQDVFNTLPQDRVSYVISTFEQYHFPQRTYDLINAQFALPFTSPAAFETVFNNLKQSLQPDGIFVGQLFGSHDAWNDGKRQMTFHTLDDAKRLLADMEIIELTEEEKDQKPVIGDIKHWHIFHIIARKQ